MTSPASLCLRAFALMLVAGLHGCATTGPAAKRSAQDPLEPMNRGIYKFNDAFDRSLAKPVARTYKKLAPRPVQTGLSNFMDNLFYPIVIANDLLQGKFKPAVKDTGRLLLNTTLGLGGLLDPASEAGLTENDEDFGQTLGRWGMPSGPYLMLPFLGPSSIRDGLGRFADSYASPVHYVEEDKVRYGIYAVYALDARARLLDAESALAGAYDRYALIRSAYLQRREYLVRDGEVPEEALEEEIMEDPPVATPETPPAQSP